MPIVKHEVTIIMNLNVHTKQGVGGEAFLHLLIKSEMNLRCKIPCRLIGIRFNTLIRTRDNIFFFLFFFPSKDILGYKCPPIAIGKFSK